MAAVDSLKELVSTMVHSYSNSSKLFSIDSKDTHIYNIKQKLADLYTSKMKGVNRDTVLPLNNAKIENRASNHVFSSSGTRQQRLYAGINRVIRKALAFSPNISFDTKGASARRSGRFIIMNANYANLDSPFAKVFIGEWPQ